MVGTLDIVPVVAVEPLGHLEPVEPPALVALVDVRAQSSSFEVRHQRMHQPSVVELPVVNSQAPDPMAVAYFTKHTLNQ